MPKIVDHDKRKDEILEIALEVFAADGYDDSNLSAIAKRCGLSRATLYQYFRNKEDIYYFALKQSTEGMFQKYLRIEWSGKGPIEDILEICDDIMATAERNRSKIKNLVISIGKSDQELEEAVYRRTAKLQHLFRRLLRNGIREGRVSSDCDVDAVVRQIVVLIESFCFQLTFFGGNSAGVIRDVLHSLMRSLEVRQG